MESFRRFFLNPIMCEICVVLNDNLDRTIGKTSAAAFVALDDRCLAARLSDDDNVRKYGRSGVRCQIYLEGLFKSGLFRNSIDERFRKRCVQCRETISVKSEFADQ